jgi:hypothetical protein
MKRNVAKKATGGTVEAAQVLPHKLKIFQFMIINKLISWRSLDRCGWCFFGTPVFWVLDDASCRFTPSEALHVA